MKFFLSRMDMMLMVFDDKLTDKLNTIILSNLHFFTLRIKC